MFKNKIEDLLIKGDRFNYIYRGVIEDNKDPLKAGRCKIRIFGLHTEFKRSNVYDSIPTDELPWAQPALSLIGGSISGLGCWSIPVQGSHVFVFFEAGNFMQPRYFASVPGIPTEKPNTIDGFSDPDGVFPNTESVEPNRPNALNEPDLHRLARGNTENTPISYRSGNKEENIQTTGSSWNEPDPSYETEYPYNTVISPFGSIVIELDSTPNKERIHIFHPSNTFIEIDKSGNIIVKNNSNSYEIIGSNKYKYVKGNDNETVIGNKDIKVNGTYNLDTKSRTITIDGNYNIEATGNCSISVDGNCNIETGGDCNIEASGICNIQASIINLN